MERASQYTVLTREGIIKRLQEQHSFGTQIKLGEYIYANLGEFPEFAGLTQATIIYYAGKYTDINKHKNNRVKRVKKRLHGKLPRKVVVARMRAIEMIREQGITGNSRIAGKLLGHPAFEGIRYPDNIRRWMLENCPGKEASLLPEKESEGKVVSMAARETSSAVLNLGELSEVFLVHHAGMSAVVDKLYNEVIRLSSENGELKDKIKDHKCPDVTAIYAMVGEKEVRINELQLELSQAQLELTQLRMHQCTNTSGDLRYELEALRESNTELEQANKQLIGRVSVLEADKRNYTLIQERHFAVSSGKE